MSAGDADGRAFGADVAVAAGGCVGVGVGVAAGVQADMSTDIVSRVR